MTPIHILQVVQQLAEKINRIYCKKSAYYSHSACSPLYSNCETVSPLWVKSCLCPVTRSTIYHTLLWQDFPWVWAAVCVCVAFCQIRGCRHQVRTQNLLCCCGTWLEKQVSTAGVGTEVQRNVTDHCLIAFFFLVSLEKCGKQLVAWKITAKKKKKKKRAEPGKAVRSANGLDALNL